MRPSSSGGQSGCLLSSGSRVRILPGTPLAKIYARTKPFGSRRAALLGGCFVLSAISDTLPFGNARAPRSCLPVGHYPPRRQVSKMDGKRDRGCHGMDRNELTLRSLIDHFQLHNRSDGKSPRTVGWYNEALGLFTDWLHQHGIPTSLEHLEEDRAREFVLYLQTRNGLWGKASNHTVNNRVRALRAFSAWVHRLGYTTKDRLKNLGVPKVTEKVIEPMTAEEVQKIFGSINPNTFMGPGTQPSSRSCWTPSSASPRRSFSGTRTCILRIGTSRFSARATRKGSSPSGLSVYEL